jgi:nucleotide-binding universal stress UspA family protein
MSEPIQDSVRTVVLGTDGSESAELALEWAIDIGKFREAAIVVVCAFDSPRSFRKRGSLYLQEARDSLEAEAKEIVADAVNRLQAEGVEATGVAIEGAPHDAILSTADDRGADIIVIGRGGRPGVREYLMGITAERVIRHARVPVFVVT